MKNVIFILISLLALTISSCSTTEKFVVKGPINTEFYTPDKYTSVKVSDGNEAKVEISSDMYCGYMLAKPAGSHKLVPFGINYKTKNHTGTKAALGVAYPIMSSGMAVMLGGTIGVLAGDESSFLLGMVAGGAALSGIGAGVLAITDSRLKQTAYDYNFGYDKVQTFNVPELTFTQLNPNPTKQDLQSNSGNSNAKPKKKATTVLSNASAAGSKATKTKKDWAKAIAGQYEGVGKLYLKSKLDENYPETTVIIEAIDKTHVSVRIVESDEDFFEDPLNFTIVSSTNGSYNLQLNELKDCTITIGKNGSLTLNHPKVNIDDTTYTLKITAKKF